MTELPGLFDIQLLKFVEIFYILDMCSVVEASNPPHIPSMQLLELVFLHFEDEILAEPCEFDLPCDSLITLSIY
jgi:hypothetical protein